MLYFNFTDQDHYDQYFKLLGKGVVSPIISSEQLIDTIHILTTEDEIKQYFHSQLNTFLKYQIKFESIIGFFDLKELVKEWFFVTSKLLKDIEQASKVLFHITPLEIYDYYKYTAIRKNHIDLKNFLYKWITYKYTLKEWEDNPDLNPIEIAKKNEIDDDSLKKIVSLRKKLYYSKVKKQIKIIEKTSPVSKIRLAEHISAYLKKQLPVDVMSSIDATFSLNRHITLYESWPLIREGQPDSLNYYDINHKLSFYIHEALFIYCGLISSPFSEETKSALPGSFEFLIEVDEDQLADFYLQLKQVYKLINSDSNLANVRQIFFGGTVTKKVKLQDIAGMKTLINEMLKKNLLKPVYRNAYAKVMLKCFLDGNGIALNENIRGKRTKLSDSDIQNIIRTLQ